MAQSKNKWKPKLQDGKLPIHNVISREEFETQYLQKPSKEMIAKQERAFNALLAYEKNCLKHEAKCIDPQMAKIPKGEQMSDFAMIYGTTIKEMKDQWRQVEYTLSNDL